MLHIMEQAAVLGYPLTGLRTELVLVGAAIFHDQEQVFFWMGQEISGQILIVPLAKLLYWEADSAAGLESFS